MNFVISKVLWVFLSPGNALVLLLLLGAFLSVAQRESWRHVGRSICFVVALMFFVVAIFPVGEWMLTPLEDRFAEHIPSQVDGIILVGGDENPEITNLRGKPSAKLSASDYIAFAALARKYPDAKLVFTGGSGLITPYDKLKNAAVARAALESIGVNVDGMLFEDQSRTTFENAADTANLIHPKPEQNWLLVTGAEHMVRSMATFRKAGFNVFPVPSSYMTTGEVSSHLRFALADHLEEISIATHEYAGLVAYYLMGHTDAIWPH